jgi:PAS domain S-box-containing protein
MDPIKGHQNSGKNPNNRPNVENIFSLFERRDKSFRDAIEKSGAGYFCISKEGFYVEVNREWLKLYKYDKAEEVLGKHFRLSRSNEDFEELENVVNKVLKGQTINYGEVRRICKDGSEGFHNLALSPVFIDGKIEGFEGFIIDTTKMMLAERELIKKMYKITQSSHHSENQQDVKQSKKEKS